MAQYFHVLSQTETSTVDELRQYYPNIIENQTVQYVINSEEQSQPFQGQQILVSPEQLMVIKNSGQEVIVDQSVAYQNPQYVLHDSGVDFQNTHSQQQVYYMEEVDGDRQVHIEQQQIQSPPEPIVLNHQLQQTPLRNTIAVTNATKTGATTQIHQLQQSAQHGVTQVPVRQSLQSRGSPRQGQLPLLQQARTASQVQPQPVQHQNSLQQLPVQKTSDAHEMVNLRDGRVMTLGEYKQMILEKQAAAATATNVLPTRPEVPPLIKYANSQPATKAKACGRGGARGRGRRPQPRVNPDNQSLRYSQVDNINSVQQPQQQQQRFIGPQQMKMQPKSHLPQTQFAQHRQQMMQQQVALRQQQQNQVSQQAQSVSQPQYVQPKYIIQAPSHSQQHAQCPLPSYVASRQIQQIIESTPISEEFSDSIRMLVLLENGEQRLITFTLPREVCTIQEILEQVGVPFHPDTKIECTETNHGGINYLVTVGIHNPELINQDEVVEEIDHLTNSQKSEGSGATELVPLSEGSPAEIPPETESPRYIPGLLAVCNHCGYTSENFNRCLRCRYKLPDEVKTRPALNSGAANGKKLDVLKSLQSSLEKKPPLKNPGVGNKLQINGPNRKKKQKLMDLEPLVLTVSSDEEEQDSSTNKLIDTDQLIRRLSNSSVTLSAIKKEPSLSDIQQNVNEDDTASAVRGGGKEDVVDNFDVSTTLICRTIRIGSYRYIPHENLIVKSQGIVLKVPSPKDPSDIKLITIEKKHIVKVLVNFQKALPVIFYYVIPAFGEIVREQLGMVEGDDLYFNPVSSQEAFKRITILPEVVNEEIKNAFKHIYGKPCNIMDELTTKEANDILVKTCPKELSKVIANSGYTEVKQLLIYPPGKGGLPINTEDYVCLAQDQFLNDVIIDFYLKYVVLNLPKEQQEKVHVFSTFFYKRLTTKPVKASRRSHPAEVDSNLTPAQKRHARVEKWTKSVNLFEKDYVIIPINENCHWFLAIVCFPGMNGCVTIDGNPVQVETKQKKKSRTSTIGNVTISPVKKEKEDKSIPCDEGDLSDRDEAEGDDSELDSEHESEDSEPPPDVPPDPSKRLPIKQPCILIFDSLAGASRARVVATLRDYLTCEYKAKMGKERIFNKDVIKGSCPKIPQQTNFTDCGLYLLQYVEQFFKDPILDYHIPIKQLKSWFDEFVVTKKREDISLLIKNLMIIYNKDVDMLPDIMFPTLNGILITRSPEDDEDEFMEDFEDDEETYEEGDTSTSCNDTCNSEAQMELEMETIPTASRICISINPTVKNDDAKPAKAGVMQCDGFLEQPVSNAQSLKPTLSELQPQSNKDTLSYLKSKRINRHKNNEPFDVKKFKQSAD